MSGSGVSSTDGSPQVTQPLMMGYVAGDTVLGYRTDQNARFPRNPPTQRIVMATNASGLAVWTFATPYQAGVTPVISLAKVNATGDVINLDITAISNTSVTVKASKSVVSLGTLSISVVAAISVHIKADQP